MTNSRFNGELWLDPNIFGKYDDYILPNNRLASVIDK